MQRNYTCWFFLKHQYFLWKCGTELHVCASIQRWDLTSLVKSQIQENTLSLQAHTQLRKDIYFSFHKSHNWRLSGLHSWCPLPALSVKTPEVVGLPPLPSQLLLTPPSFTCPSPLTGSVDFERKWSGACF